MVQQHLGQIWAALELPRLTSDKTAAAVEPR